MAYFKAIYRFSKSKDKKLQAIRTVNEYLHRKRAKRIIIALRDNLEGIRIKEKKLRQACQFNLFRRPIHLKKQVIAAFKLHLKRKSQVEEYLLRKAFNVLCYGINLQKIENQSTPERN